MYKRATLYFLFFLFLGCTPSYEQSKIMYPICVEPRFLTIFKEYSSTEPEDFSGRIKEVERSLSGMTITEEDRALQHLRLAVLLSHYKNLRPDYQRSLRELDLFLLSAGDEDKAVLRNFQSLLEKVIRLDREGKDLKKKLELLKTLDIDIEKRGLSPANYKPPTFLLIV